MRARARGRVCVRVFLFWSTLIRFTFLLHRAFHFVSYRIPLRLTWLCRCRLLALPVPVAPVRSCPFTYGDRVDTFVYVVKRTKILSFSVHSDCDFSSFGHSFTKYPNMCWDGNGTKAAVSSEKHKHRIWWCTKCYLAHIKTFKSLSSLTFFFSFFSFIFISMRIHTTTRRKIELLRCHMCAEGWCWAPIVLLVSITSICSSPIVKKVECKLDEKIDGEEFRGRVCVCARAFISLPSIRLYFDWFNWKSVHH